jgi:hypothetical protein
MANLCLRCEINNGIGSFAVTVLVIPSYKTLQEAQDGTPQRVFNFLTGT